ncbi:MAG: GIY-YIG nuclease family protein [Patescibacteria group bacterium]|nr:GIY-YIG nuclease family protein [Patescibacteria group bacterium]
MNYFVYIIKNQQGAIYIGQTKNIFVRLKVHNSNEVFSTKNQGPWKLIYFEEFTSRSDAMAREKQLKSFKGGNALKKLIDKV